MRTKLGVEGEERSVRGSVSDNSADDTYFGLADNLPINDDVARLQICIVNEFISVHDAAFSYIDGEFDSTLEAALMFKGKMLVEEILHAR